MLSGGSIAAASEVRHQKTAKKTPSPALIQQNCFYSMREKCSENELKPYLVAGLGVVIPAVAVPDNGAQVAVGIRVVDRDGHLREEDLVADHAPHSAATLGVAAK